jgi:hypothetical protein
MSNRPQKGYRDRISELIHPQGASTQINFT